MLVSLSILIIVLLLLILAVTKWKVHPFIALLLAGLALGTAIGLGGKETVDILLQGFSNTLKWIAIVVILGAFIGEVLRESGGALRIAEGIVKKTGKEKLPWAMGITGYIVSIPVFVDVAYIILQPVTEALAKQARKPIIVVGLALTAGLTISHTLIPPTPGPLAVASLLDANIGRMLLINGFVGICAMVGGILWAIHHCKNYKISSDEEINTTIEDPQLVHHSNPDKASLLTDLLPILIPIVLMGLGAFTTAESPQLLHQLGQFISMPIIAVSIGALVAAIQLMTKKRSSSINTLIESAITKSALVIMITGAGGAFGFVIRESGIQDSLGAFLTTLPWLGFMLPFIIAMVLTTATGSITVSLIGTASIVGPMIPSMSYSPEIMAALIGCGSFCVFHANSSFFWLLHKLHDIPPKVLYKTYTLQSLIMGLSGLLGVFILRLLGVD